jgi:hypothetical protein
MNSVIQDSHPPENIWTQAVILQDRTADSSMGTFGKIILNLWRRVASLCTVYRNKIGSFKFIYVFLVNLILKLFIHYVILSHCFYNRHGLCALWGTSWRVGCYLDEWLSRASLFGIYFGQSVNGRVFSPSPSILLFCCHSTIAPYWSASRFSYQKKCL